MIKYDKKETLRIFQASFVKLCNKKPFDKISMREVARDSKLSHTLLMRYYPTKKDLLLDTYQYKMLKIEDRLICCNSTFEIASVLLKMWENDQNLVSNFTITFRNNSNLNKEIYNLNRRIITPHLKRVIPQGSSFEVEYTLLCCLSYYPATLIKTGECSVKISDYIDRVSSIREEKSI